MASLEFIKALLNERDAKLRFITDLSTLLTSSDCSLDKITSCVIKHSYMQYNNDLKLALDINKDGDINKLAIILLDDINNVDHKYKEIGKLLTNTYSYDEIILKITSYIL